LGAVARRVTSRTPKGNATKGKKALLHGAAQRGKKKRGGKKRNRGADK